MKKVYLFIVLFGLIIMACSKEETTSSNDGIFIRLKNTSVYNYKNIIVEAGMTANVYEDLEPNQISEYQEFDSAFAYAFVELEIEGNTFTIQPIDFIGETMLEDGFYTYEISANESTEQYGRLGLLFIED